MTTTVEKMSHPGYMPVCSFIYGYEIVLDILIYQNQMLNDCCTFTILYSTGKNALLYMYAHTHIKLRVFPIGVTKFYISSRTTIIQRS